MTLIGPGGATYSNYNDWWEANQKVPLTKTGAMQPFMDEAGQYSKTINQIWQGLDQTMASGAQANRAFYGGGGGSGGGGGGGGGSISGGGGSLGGGSNGLTAAEKQALLKSMPSYPKLGSGATGGTGGGGIRAGQPGFIGGSGGGGMSVGLPTGGEYAGGIYHGGTAGSEPQPGSERDIYSQLIAEQRQLGQQTGTALDATQSRYDQLAQAYSSRETALSGLLEGLGQAERQQVEDARLRDLAAAQQSMIDRGLFNTNQLDSAARGINADAARNLMDLEGRLTREKMDYLSALSGETLGAQGLAAEQSGEIAAKKYETGLTPTESMADLAQLIASQREGALERALKRDVLSRETSMQQQQLTQQSQLAAYQAALQEWQTRVNLLFG